MPRNQCQKFAFTPYVTSLALKLMFKISKRPCAKPFIDFFPDLDIEIYQNIEPISISMIIQRLKTYDYLNPSEWNNDMKRIPQNCIKLFGPNDSTTLLANQLYSVFLKKFDLLSLYFNKTKWIKQVALLTHQIMFKMLQRPPSCVQISSKINSTLTQNYPFIFIPNENAILNEPNIVHNDLNSYYDYIQNEKQNQSGIETGESTAFEQDHLANHQIQDNNNSFDDRVEKDSIELENHKIIIANPSNTNNGDKDISETNKIIHSEDTIRFNNGGNISINQHTVNYAKKINIEAPIMNRNDDTASSSYIENISTNQHTISNTENINIEISSSTQNYETISSNSNTEEKLNFNDKNIILTDQNSTNSAKGIKNEISSNNQINDINNTKIESIDNSKENIVNSTTNPQENDEIANFLTSFAKLRKKEDIISIVQIIQDEQPELKLIGPNPVIEFDSISRNTLERLISFTMDKIAQY